MSSDSALADAGAAAWKSGDYEALDSIAREMIARAEKGGSLHDLALGHRYLGVARIIFRDAPSADAALKRARELYEQAGDRLGVANVMMSQGTLAVELELDVAKARRLYDECVPIVREIGSKDRIAVALGNLGEIYRLEGDQKQALANAHESLEFFTELGDSSRAGWQLFNIALLHSLRHDEEGARSLLDRAYASLRIDGNPRWLAMYFDVWFISLVRSGRWETAATLMGFLEHYRDLHHVPRLQAMFPWYSQCVERLNLALSGDDLDVFASGGAALSVEQMQQVITH